MQPATPLRLGRKARDTRSFLWCRGCADFIQGVSVHPGRIQRCRKTPPGRHPQRRREASRGLAQPSSEGFHQNYHQPTPRLFSATSASCSFSRLRCREEHSSTVHRPRSRGERSSTILRSCTCRGERKLNRTRADRNRIKKHTHYTRGLLSLSIVSGCEFLRKDSTQVRMRVNSDYLN